MQAASGELWDLLRPIEGDCRIQFYTFEDEEGKMVFWHSSAHILGQCLEQEFGSQLTVGPPIELSPKGSFFYDSYMVCHSLETCAIFETCSFAGDHRRE